MVLWHDIRNAIRSPGRVIAHEQVAVWIGSSPLEPGQCVLVQCRTVRRNGDVRIQRVDVQRQFVDPVNSESYWLGVLGPFEEGDNVEYGISGETLNETLPLHAYTFEVH